MAKRKIIWSNRARLKLFKILKFYIERNKSKSYSIKLYQTLNKEIKILLKHPEIGIKTDFELIRGMIIGDYILYYEYNNEIVIIHTIWDCRQNPDGLVIL
jgi:plasmid stabilization system protein ParE